MHLPNRVMPVGVTDRTCEKVPIKKTANIVCIRVAMINRSKAERVIFVQRFTDKNRFNWDFCGVRRDSGPSLRGIEMTILPHIKIEQRIAVWEGKRRGGNKIVASCGMKGKKMIAGITGLEPCGQCPPDRKLFDVVHCGHHRGSIRDQPRGSVSLGIFRKEPPGSFILSDAFEIESHRQGRKSVENGGKMSSSSARQVK
jgi:hypothetical protein